MDTGSKMIKIFCIYTYLWEGTTTKSPRKVCFSFRALPKQNYQARPLNKYSGHHIHINPIVTPSKLNNVLYKQSRSSLC